MPRSGCVPRPAGWLEEAAWTVPHGTSRVLAGIKPTGHRSVRRAVGCKRRAGGGATVAVLGRDGGSSVAHCGPGLACQVHCQLEAGTAVVLG